MTGNPYAGPRPLGGAGHENEKLYGRDREVADLMDLVVAERIVLLYSPSGAGKSSLLQAGLLPALRKRRFQVRPVMRVGAPPPAEVNFDPSRGNRFALSCLLSLEERLPVAERRAPASLAALKLDEYFSPEPNGELLIFDQFEEVLTADPLDRAEKIEFFAQLGEILRCKGRWAIFAMREDYLAGLDAFVDLVPTRFSNTFRLDLLKREAAIEAIRGPAQPGVDFTAEAAALLADNLRTVHVHAEDGSVATRPGPYVEPVQLQVVCRRLWDQLPEGTTSIAPAAIEQVGSVDKALEEYYASTVSHVARASGVSERDLRDWFDQQLITKQRTRGQVLQGGDESATVMPALRSLLEAHLVRSDKRLGSIWFELAHDRLIRPVLSANQLWREQNLSAFQRAAEFWVQQGKSKDTLLRGDALTDGRAWAAENAARLTPDEQAFLSASVEAFEIRQRDREQAVRLAEQAEALRRRARSLRLALAGVVVLAVGAIAAAWWAWRSQQETVRTLAAADVELVARLHASGQPARALALLARALRLHPASVPARVWAGGFLERSRARLPVRELDLGDDIAETRISADGSRILTVSGSGRFRLWDATSGQAVGAAWGPLGPIDNLALNADGTRVMVQVADLLSNSFDDAFARVFDVATGQTLRGPEGDDRWLNETVASAAFSPDGKFLVTTIQPEYTLEGKKPSERQRRAIIWDVAARKPRHILQHRGEVTFAVYSPDGSKLATGELDTRAETSRLRLWDAVTGRHLRDFPGDIHPGLAAVFHPKGTHIVALDLEGDAHLFPLGAGQPITFEHGAELDRAGFAPEGDHLLTFSSQRVKVWNAATGALVRTRRFGSRLLWFESGHYAFIDEGREDVVVRDPLTLEAIASAYLRGSVDSVALSQDGRRLVTSTAGRSAAEMWDAGPRGPAADWPAAGDPPRADLVAQWRKRLDADRRDEVVVSASGQRIAFLRAADFHFQHPPQLLDPKTGRPRLAIRPQGAQRVPPGTTYTAAFSDRDADHLVAIADSQGEARIFDEHTGLPIGEVMRHGAPIQRVRFTQDARYLLTLSPGYARLWDARSGYLIAGHIEKAGLLPDVRDAALPVGAGSPAEAAALATRAEALAGYRLGPGGAWELIPLADRMRVFVR